MSLKIFGYKSLSVDFLSSSFKPEYIDLIFFERVMKIDLQIWHSKSLDLENANLSIYEVNENLIGKVLTHYTDQDFDIEYHNNHSDEFPSGWGYYLWWGKNTRSRDIQNIIKNIQHEIDKAKGNGLKQIKFSLDERKKSHRETFQSSSSEVIEHFTKENYFIKWARFQEGCCEMEFCKDGNHPGYIVDW